MAGMVLPSARGSRLSMEKFAAAAMVDDSAAGVPVSLQHERASSLQSLRLTWLQLGSSGDSLEVALPDVF